MAGEVPGMVRRAHSQVWKYSAIARPGARPRGWLDSGEGRRQEDMWQTDKSPRPPDFRRHRQSQEVLWLNNLYRPEIAAVNMDVGMGPCASDRNLLDCSHSRRLGGGDREVTAETVRKLNQDGHIHGAVEVLEALLQSDRCVSKSLVYAVLKKCVARKDLALGTRVHAATVQKGYHSDTFLGFHILRMYASHGRLQEAMDAFDAVVEPDAFTWSGIISAHVKQGQDRQAMELYQRMRRCGVTPDGHVFVAALQACARGSDLKSGKQVHADVLACGVESNVFVSSCLVDMYAKCGSLEDAQGVFDGLGERDVVTWNAMIAGYSQQGMGDQALHLYGAMLEEGKAVPNSVTFASALQACASVGTSALGKGRQVHAQIRGQGHDVHSFVASSLVNMYAKCGSLEDAQRVFDEFGQKDVVTWNAMIAGYSQEGRGQEALYLYNAMQEEGKAVPNSVTFVCLLQACASLGCQALEQGRQLHMQIGERGLQADVYVASSLMNMYAKCGSLEDARRVFDTLGEKTAVTWNAMIAGYSQQGMGQEALRLYSAMQAEGVFVPDSVTFVCLLQACASVGTLALEQGRHLHAQITEQGQEDVFVANSLMNMYAKCGSLEDARRIFDGLHQKDAVMWNAMIAGYSQQGMGQEALRLYSIMREEGVALPDSVTFVCLLQACASVGTPGLEMGKQLHMQIREQGQDADVFVASSLVNMYAKCGSLKDAQSVFDGVDKKDVAMWNALISGYSQQGMGQQALHLHSVMQEEGEVILDSVTFVCLLQACGNVGAMALETGRQLHLQIREQGHQCDPFVANSLVNMYAKCGSLEEAQTVFEGLRQKDVVTWNAMIGGYSQQGMGQEALHLYHAMQENGMAAPDSVTFACLLQACSSLGTAALETGKQLHTQIRGKGHEADVFVANSLINMYVKCGSVEDAQRVFDGLSQKNVVTWNAMIAGYSQKGMVQEALDAYYAMQEESMVVPDCVTLVCLLQACANLGTPAFEKGKHLHTLIREQGLEADMYVASSLVNMYAKCGSLENARRVFDGVGRKDAVMWSAMIAGYSQQDMGQEALRLYSVMQDGSAGALDSMTFVCLLQACANVAALYLGTQLHAQIVGQGLHGDLFVAGSLINMYGKCGSMVDAQQVFDSLPELDVVVWNALIAGYTCQGDSDAVFHLFERMKESGMQPDSITFLSVLTACSHVGLVNEGREYFETMGRLYSLTPTENHYTCMVDLLGRAGHVDEALDLVRRMPALPNAAIWHTLMGACQKWNNVEVGFHAFNEALKLDRKDAAAYVLMSNIYLGARMWDRAQDVQAKRTNIKAWKQPGQSWWTDSVGLLHSFLVGEEMRYQRF